MSLGFPLFPEQASTIAGQVDSLLLFLIGVSVIFAGLIFLIVIVFAIKYRRRSEKERPRPILGNLSLEIIWTVIPLGLALVMFAWGAWLYFVMNRPPADAMEVFVVAKQWMWKIQQPSGMREINELHVPVDRPVKLTMTSEDTIHSFFVPAFRVKKDVVPGRYSTVWFQATKPGEYHLFCTQYCGTNHANMIGRIVVMTPEAYQGWLKGGGPSVSLAAAGEALFQQKGCAGCHLPDGKGPAPSLVGVFGKPVTLTTKQTVIADEAYLREHILTPGSKVVAGYPPIMPPFKGLLSEDQLLQLIAYIKSLATEQKAKAQ
ncbi:MAG: cytochrome c oxidase subunit II [Candidatus Methylomirabilales bacterium]